MDIEHSKRIRTAAKSRLTLAAKKLESLDETASRQEILSYIEQFERRLSAYDEAQSSVELLTDSDALETEVEESEAYRDNRFSYLVKAKELLDRKTNDAVAADMESASASNSVLHQAKLPRLELPKFSGDHTQWQSFWDKFTAIVHMSDLPSVSKFTYLQSLLKGEALSAINGLALTDANYEIARELLQQRFGRRERIVFSHIQELLNITTTSKTTSDLWSLYDKLQTHIRSLETLEIKGNTYGVILTPLVLHKLPENIRLEWARQGDGKESDLDALLTFLHAEIVRRERSQTFRSPSDPSKPSFKPDKSNEKYSASSLQVLTSGGGKNNKKVVCLVCDRGHATDKCYSWTRLSLEGRKTQCRKKRLCFLCFGPHLVKDCKAQAKCACSGRHHPLLCDSTRARHAETESSDTEGNCKDRTLGVDSSLLNTTSNCVSDSVRHTVLQTAQVTVCDNQQRHTSVNVLFDTGSNRSYISSSCARKLGLRAIGKEKVSIATFGQAKSNVPKLRNKFKVKLFNLESEPEEMTLTESPMICAPIQKLKLPQKIVERLNHEGLPLAAGSLVDSDSQLDIDILVGLDYFWQFVKPNVCRITEYLSAQESKFGWILSGSWVQNERQKNSLSYQFLCMTDTPDHLCHRFWDLDAIGIGGKDENQCSDSEVLKRFNNSITFENGRYTVSLPWKSDGMKNELHDNMEIATRRSENLTRRLGRDPSLEVDYHTALSELERLDIIHEVTKEEMVSDKNPVFYLPHRPVVREASTSTKIRPVFDASCKGLNNISLNDCMETGPNLIPNLLEVLLRFRRWKFGLSADITKAFLQIKVAKEDQDVHRFIWDINGQRRIMRFDRVVFGNASSPFLLNATIKHHLSGFENTRVVNELKQNLYVDDWLSGCDTEEEIEHMITSASDIMNQGSFPLTKWGSNSTSVSQATNKGFDDTSMEILPALKILGMHWATNEDFFYFEASPINLEGVQYTKRLVLSFIARIYDPMGFLNPFTVMTKILFQDLWQLGLGWDEPLPHELQNQMSAWVLGFRDINQWRIPRCLSIQTWEACDKQLLCFSDASSRAFGCCVYLKVIQNGLSRVSLVASKVRVAPLKKITLPRLELLGALLAARLLCFVRTALALSAEVPYSCFTDSTIALHWIKSDPQRWKQFVRNRVTEIHTLTNPSNWKHISGKNNPADLLTRGVSAAELINSSQWLQGPVELGVFDSNSENLHNEDIMAEMVRKVDPTLVSVQAHIPIDFKRFSHFPKLVKVMGWILRFVNNLKSSTHGRSKTAQSLDSDDLEAAKICVFKTAQRESFADEIDHLREGRMVPKGSSLFKLSPFLDESGLLRVGGRLQMSDYTYNEKHPIILPKGHVSTLLVTFQHQLLKHAGVSSLLTSLRNNFWIFGVRVTSKKVCRECVLCQRQDARACSQIMAPLPSDRINRSHPFSVVGLDHAGPVYCSDTGKKKHYILLFTCGVIRAVHLELVPSLCLSDFMLAFRKFSARRGLPTVIYSDNAKTFDAACSLIKQFGPAAPSWKFSIPLAPWYGGWWERLVRSTKSALRKSLGRELVDKAHLETILVEVEACINSRPLTYVEEHNNPLTPSHFLLGRSSPFVGVQKPVSPQTRSDFCLAAKEQRVALEKFWRLWSEDYIRNLPSLGNGKSKVDLDVGSLVLVREEGKPRLKWPLGKVTKVHKGKDGLVRAVSLKTERGELMRAVKKLHKLEVTNTASEPSEISGEIPASSPEISRSRFGRPIRPRQILDL